LPERFDWIFHNVFLGYLEIDLIAALQGQHRSGKGLERRCDVLRQHDAIRFGRIRFDLVRCGHLAQLQLVAADEDVSEREVAVDGAE
jgi:hypothetical protein